MLQHSLGCVVCSAPTAQLFMKYNYPIDKCTRCGHAAVDGLRAEEHANTTYGDEYFFGGGAGYPNYLSQGDLVRDHGRAYASVLARHGAPGSCLDVGCAAGFVLQGLADAGWTGVGLDPNPRMVQHARDVLKLNAVVGTLESYESSEQFDLVSLIQVVGHFWNLRQAIGAGASHVKPGGLCLIEYWNRDSLPARLLGEHWHEYSPPSVLHWFGPSDLDLLMAQFGLVRVDAGKPKKYISGEHLKSLLAYKSRGVVGGSILAAMTKLVPGGLKVPYPAWDVAWSLYRKAS
ncbi:MAG: class I SAM-dependent methyltransferase [Hyphomicrobiaceae bacterium]|nr:class I SAM-dependent methyltransferase [Hyphomicrobiaceae bacterium]